MDSSSANVLREAPGDRASTGITREVETGFVRAGRADVPMDFSALIPFDINEGIKKAKYDTQVAKADRMYKTVVYEFLQRVFRMYELDEVLDGVKFDFLRSMCLCYVLNGSSVLQPDNRVMFISQGSEYSFDPIKKLAEKDLRRFFRGLADFIKTLTYPIYMTPKNDEDHVIRDHMIADSEVRGIRRFPYLCFDAADACLKLSYEERAAVIKAKEFTVGATPNSVDSRNAARVVESLDAFDSSNGRSVSNHRPNREYY